MSRTKEIVTAMGTLACALGIGFVMQSTDTASQRYGASNREAAPTPLPETTSPQVSLPVRPEQEQVAVIDVQDVTLTSALPNVAALISSSVVPPEPVASEPLVPMTLEDIMGSEEEPVVVEDTVPDTSCEIVATAEATFAAQAILSVSAPCHRQERVTIHHNGMFFTVRTDEDGRTELTVPALSQDAAFIVAFNDGEGSVALSRHTDIADYNRVILQWAGPAGFQLHAREFGAEYGALGHVWHGAEGAPIARLSSGTGGYLTRHGLDDLAEPHIAEVYTFPAKMSGRNGQIDLSVEAEITAENCGLEIEAQTMERESTGRMRTRNLTLAVPGCDAAGDYLVLNNVLDDMKVAAR